MTFRRAPMLLVSAMAAIFLTTAPVSAQGDLAVAILSVDDRGYPDVTAVITADLGGRPITALSAAELRIAESGAPATPTSVQVATDSNIPLAVVITLDVSGSMRDGETLEKAQSAAISLINSLGPADSAAVVSFGDQVRIEQTFTRDRRALTAAVSRLEVDGTTALYDAVAQSAQLAASSGHARRAVVILTDGKESGDASGLDREASLARSAQSDALFYVIGVGFDIDRDYLDQLAARSRGRFFEASGGAAVPAVYASLADILRSHLVVSFRASAPTDVSERSLAISVAQGGATGTAQLVYGSLRALAPARLAPPAGPLAPPAARPVAPIVPLLVIGLGVVAIAAGVVVLKQKGREQKEQAAGSGLGTDVSDVIPVGPQLERGQSRAKLVVVGGPDEVIGQSFDVAEAPVIVGSGLGCTIRLPESPAVAREHARLWERDAKIMLHHVASGHTTTVAGKPVTWASLDPGDRVSIGPYVFECVRSDPGVGPAAGA